MRQKTLAALLGILALVSAGPAFADPITITTNSSGVGGLVFVEEAGQQTLRSYPFLIDDNNAMSLTATLGGTSAAAAAAISTNLSDLSRMRSSGAVNVSYDTQTGGDEAVGTSDFFVFFNLASPHTYSFNAAFEASGGTVSTVGHDDWSQWVVSFLQMSPDMRQLAEIVEQRGHHTATIAQSGVLPPGIYRFVVLATARARGSVPQGTPGSGQAFANFAFGLDLSPFDDTPAPTPEPASMLLIATGLGGVLAARRRLR